ncbi:MAG: hypothetical protein LBH28_00900 [Oscillospiraceae bacterium]|jgi:hypothetical protein|nr:hypothetical protein [Oscillospiraceae bacterium]
MSKAVKMLLMFCSLLCMVVLIIFTIELMLLNKNDGDVGNTAGNMNQTTSSAPPLSTGSSTVPPPTDSSPAGIQDTQPESPLPSAKTPTGKRYEILISETMLLVLYADEELFEYEGLFDSDTFTYMGGGDASLDILPTYLGGGTDYVVQRALKNFLGGNDADVEGVRPVGLSPISGIYVSGKNGGVTYAAWICEIPTVEDDENKEDVGTEFVIQYRDERQRNALYDILDSMEMIPRTTG